MDPRTGFSSPEKARRGLVVILDSEKGGYVEDTLIEAELLSQEAEVELWSVEDAASASHRLREADVVISWHHIALERPVLELMPQCRGIVRASVGFDNIALDVAGELGITVCNIPDYGTEEVADHTLMLLLGVARNIRGTGAAADSGVWRWQAAGTVRRLRGRTLGIVGLGRIGAAVALRAMAFGLRVIFFDPFVRSGLDKALGIERVDSLADLLECSDILTLHTPLTPETRHMIGDDELRRLPRGATLINTSRGEVVDQEALIDALSNGRLAGAGLDVLEGEPEVPNALRHSERVLLTAHSAFYSEESLAELREKAARAALAFMQGEIPRRDVLVPRPEEAPLERISG